MKTYIIETVDGPDLLQVNADWFSCGANLCEFFVEGQDKPIAVVFKPSNVSESGKLNVAPRQP